MKNAIHLNTSRLFKSAMITSLAVTALAGSAATSTAQQCDLLCHELGQLVIDNSDPQKTELVQISLTQLENLAPADARLSYAQALMSLDGRRYEDAAGYLKKTVQLDPRNLDAWKASIWVSVITRDYRDALSSIERLSGHMGVETASPARARKTREMAAYLGSIMGYLDGPRGSLVNPSDMAISEETVLANLTGTVLEAFETGRRDVVDDFMARAEQLDYARQNAQENEVKSREQRMERLSDEGEYALSELNQVEDRRQEDRKFGTGERNTIAATRQYSTTSYSSNYPYSYRGYGRRYVPTTVAGYFVNRPYSYHLNNGWGYRSGVKRGLDDVHYADVNRRQVEYHNYLTTRRRRLQTELRRISKDEDRLLTRPNVGNTPHTRAAAAKAVALATYIPLPVNPNLELEQLVQACRDACDPNDAVNDTEEEHLVSLKSEAKSAI